MKYVFGRLGIMSLAVGLVMTTSALGEAKKDAKNDSAITIIKAQPTTLATKGKPTMHLVGDTIVTPSGLKYIELKPGTGGQPKAGQTVYVHFVGTFLDGKKFDSSRDQNVPYDFVLGKGEVIKGWDEGIGSMKIGGLRKLIVPYQLAYGETGDPRGIPPKSTLVFEIELLGVK